MADQSGEEAETGSSDEHTPPCSIVNGGKSLGDNVAPNTDACGSDSATASTSHKKVATNKLKRRAHFAHELRQLDSEQRTWDRCLNALLNGKGQLRVSEGAALCKLAQGEHLTLRQKTLIASVMLNTSDAEAHKALVKSGVRSALELLRRDRRPNCTF